MPHTAISCGVTLWPVTSSLKIVLGRVQSGHFNVFRQQMELTKAVVALPHFSSEQPAALVRN